MTALTNLWAVDPRLKLLGLHISDDENVSTVMRFGSVAANQCKACYAAATEFVKMQITAKPIAASWELHDFS